jgi:hypothetical protein
MSRSAAHYFERVLASVPGKFEFEFFGVFHGVDTFVVHFQSTAYTFAEFMELNREGKVSCHGPSSGQNSRRLARR